MKLNKTTLADQIYTVLRQDIISQTLKSGEKLTIKMIQERFDTSYTPAREALRRLAQEGLLESVTNVGASVIVLTRDDIREIFDFCLVLDQAAMVLAMEGADRNAFLSSLQENMKLQEQDLERRDLDSFKIHSDDFHDIFFRYCSNTRLYHSAQLLRSQLSILTNRYQILSMVTSHVVVEHRKIADALSLGHTEEACTFLKEHLNYEKNYMLTQSAEE